MKNLKTLLLLTFYLLFSNYLFAQSKPKYKRTFLEFSLFPGLGSNGIDCGNYKNDFAFHLFSGYSGGNEVFELAGISNFNKGEVNGWQFAGLGNFVGGNALEFAKNRGKLSLKDARMMAQMNGWQVSGLINTVTGDVRGWQMSGGFNINARNTTGMQWAGVSNQTYKNLIGIQVSGFHNFVGGDTHGYQFAGFLNITKETLYGIQIGSINFAREILGKNSRLSSGKTGAQIGLINIAQKMDGFQIGLINFASRSHGTHIGLINIFSNAGKKGQYNGTPIGLLNVGEYFHLRASTNETFQMNFELASGNSKNSLVLSQGFHNLNQNSLTYSKNTNAQVGEVHWGIGYGFEKYYYNRSFGPADSKFFVNFGVQWQYLNWQEKFQRELNLLTRLKFSFGHRFHRKLRSLYGYMGVTLNGFTTENLEKNLDSMLNLGQLNHYGKRTQLGLGYVIGVHWY